MCKGLLIAEENWVNLTSTDTCFYIGDHTHKDSWPNFQPRIMNSSNPRYSIYESDKVNHNYCDKDSFQKY